jgi:hypothetical protein
MLALPLAGREEYEPLRPAISGAELVRTSDSRRNFAWPESHPGGSDVGPQNFPDAEKPPPVKTTAL